MQIRDIDYIDVSRAFCHAEALREVYVQLPDEDAEEGMCGLLGKYLYGTRDAAQNWPASYVGFMEECVFVRGILSPCCFHNKEHKIRCVVHGDDFAVLGKRNNLDWFREKIRSKYPVKIRGRMGPGDADDKSIRLLNRVIIWDGEGIHWEGDQRNAEILVRELGLLGDSRGATTPADKKTGPDIGSIQANGQDELREGELGQHPLDPSTTSKYRGTVARVNYLGRSIRYRQHGERTE